MRDIIISLTNRDALRALSEGSLVLSRENIEAPGITPSPFVEGRDWVKIDYHDTKGMEAYYREHRHEADRIANSGRRTYQEVFSRTEESRFLAGRDYFFILGSQRSGTTLMEFILGSHPDTAVFGEPGAYDKITNRNPEPKGKMLGFKIPSWTWRHEYFKWSFPHAKIIFMERDLLQTVASMVALTEWIPKAMEGELTAAIKGVEDISRRRFYETYQNKFKASGEGYMGAALCAFLNRSHVLRYEKSGLNMIRIDYEELVNKPKPVAERVLAFLSLPWNDIVLDHPSCHEGVYTGQNNSKRPIDTTSIPKWKKVLSSDQISKLEVLFNELASTL